MTLLDHELESPKQRRLRRRRQIALFCVLFLLALSALSSCYELKLILAPGAALPRYVEEGRYWKLSLVDGGIHFRVVSADVDGSDRYKRCLAMAKQNRDAFARLLQSTEEQQLSIDEDLVQLSNRTTSFAADSRDLLRSVRSTLVQHHSQLAAMLKTTDAEIQQLEPKPYRLDLSAHWTGIDSIRRTLQTEPIPTLLGSIRHNIVTIQLRCSFLPLLLPPLVIFWRCHRQLKRLRRGLCPRCLYDLRASPDRCPECGFVVDSAQPAPAPPQPSP